MGDGPCQRYESLFLCDSPDTCPPTSIKLHSVVEGEVAGPLHNWSRRRLPMSMTLLEEFYRLQPYIRAAYH